MACVTAQCSPRAAAFPPQPPPELAPFCSAGSSVLRRGPTPPLRACPPYGFAPSRSALLSWQGQRRSPGSRACCFPACSGSQTTGDSACPRDDGQADVAFPCNGSGRHLHLNFRSSIPGPPVPLFTLRRPPRDYRRKTRGQGGSLLLSCRTLSFPTTCRFIPAHPLLFRVSTVLQNQNLKVESRKGAGPGPTGSRWFPFPAHQTGRADFPHPAFRQISPQAHGRGPMCTSRNRSTPNVPNTTASE
jgi:hypothetical protein